MAKCAICSLSVDKLHRWASKDRVSWICTMCNSRLNNGLQLNRTTGLTRLGLLVQLAYIAANLVTVKGRQLILSKGKK